MSTETTVAVEVVDRETGELVTFEAASLERLAELRAQNGQLIGQINGDNKLIDAEIVHRLDLDATRSASAGRFRIKVPAPTVRETDELGLRAALQQLADDGRISPEAIDRAVEIIEVPKARRPGIKALHAHADERVREVAAQFDREVEAPVRRATVTEVPVA
jgi:hypothetical protein